jgi:hypothetical protein
MYGYGEQLFLHMSNAYLGLSVSVSDLGLFES